MGSSILDARCGGPRQIRFDVQMSARSDMAGGSRSQKIKHMDHWRKHLQMDIGILQLWLIKYLTILHIIDL